MNFNNNLQEGVIVGQLAENLQQLSISNAKRSISPSRIIFKEVTEGSGSYIMTIVRSHAPTPPPLVMKDPIV
jgi:hypothetical protein